jgi:hypothetical protein
LLVKTFSQSALRALVVCATISFVTVGASSAGWAGVAGHCVGRLVPVAPRDSSGVIKARAETIGCYTTFAGAMRVATRGALRLPANFKASNLTQAMLDKVQGDAPDTTYVLSNEYDGSSYTGTTWTWTASGQCTSTTSWTLSYVGSSENDKYNSSKAFSGCNTENHYWNSQFGPPIYPCTPNCSDMGSMDNQTSSLKWFH